MSRGFLSERNTRAGRNNFKESGSYANARHLGRSVVSARACCGRQLAVAILNAPITMTALLTRLQQRLSGAIAANGPTSKPAGRRMRLVTLTCVITVERRVGLNASNHSDRFKTHADEKPRADRVGTLDPRPPASWIRTIAFRAGAEGKLWLLPKRAWVWSGRVEQELRRWR